MSDDEYAEWQENQERESNAAWEREWQENNRRDEEERRDEEDRSRRERDRRRAEEGFQPDDTSSGSGSKGPRPNRLEPGVIELIVVLWLAASIVRQTAGQGSGSDWIWTALVAAVIAPVVYRLAIPKLTQGRGRAGRLLVWGLLLATVFVVSSNGQAQNRAREDLNRQQREETRQAVGCGPFTWSTCPPTPAASP